MSLTLDSPVEDLLLSRRIHFALLRHFHVYEDGSGYKGSMELETVGDLIKFSATELLDFEGLGRRGVQEIVEVLADGGFQLSDTESGDTPKGRPEPKLLTPESSVEEMEISYRAYNGLKNKNLQTVGEVISLSPKRLLAKKHGWPHGFGVKCVEEIIEVLAESGLSLSPEPFTCPICNDGFASDMSYKHHVEYHHSPERPTPLKVAKKVIVSVELTCPYCEETIPQTDSGSLFWMVCELPSTLTCPHCGKQSKTPKV